MIRVLVADAHPVVRFGLAAILSQHGDVTVQAEAATGAEVCRLVAHDRWDVIVLDPTLAGVDGPNGLDLLKEIKHRRPKLPILVLGSHAAEDFAARALRAGAAGYLRKTAGPEELVGAVRQLAEGRKYMSPAVAEELMEVLGNSSQWTVQHRLSDREYQVLCLLGSGKSVREIAHELRLSVKTIATHRVHILNKMQMQTDAQLVHYVLQRRLAEPR
jgi:two-component system, NarL family, invasion response regulator UvrY